MAKPSGLPIVGHGFRLFQGHAGLAIPTAQLGVIVGQSAWFHSGLEESVGLGQKNEKEAKIQAKLA